MKTLLRPLPLLLSSYSGHGLPLRLAGLMWALSAQVIDPWMLAPAPPLRRDSGLVFHPLDLSVLICNLERIKVTPSGVLAGMEGPIRCERLSMAVGTCASRILASFSLSPLPRVPEDSCLALFALRVLWSVPCRTMGEGWLKIRSRIVPKALEQGLQTVAREPDPACRQLCEHRVFGT